MKCEWVRQNIVLHVYGELADDVRHELEQHVARCADCAAELKAEQDFHTLLLQDKVSEPSANLLASSRMRLQEALETAKQGGFFSRLALDPAKWLRQVRFSPALASAILILGFAGGVGTTYKLYGSHPVASVADQTQPQPQALNDASITGIESVTQQPGSSQVTIKYNTVSTQEAQGSLNDQRIQQLLLYAARNNYNSGVRMDSVGLMTQNPNDQHFRDALMYALQYDSNPGVRFKALDALGPYVKDDTRVRDSLLQALVNDSNPGVREEALRLLEPVKADGSVRGVLMTLAAKDQSQYIRSQARTLLAQLPEID
ncbi:MAG TPA: HEAT repeat domain-containing protein [Verrucomicrobiae bacterium]|jgi:anti-sigma factor RsiW|nr:HEAT repeat domain-containing protein [Verrucomicrobiae bacterium]